MHGHDLLQKRGITMLLSKLGGKEIVNLNDGGRLGIIADSDLIIDGDTGKILALLVPDKRAQFRIFGDRSEIEVPWEAVRKIGNDMIIVELDEAQKSNKKFTL